jgi:hypothetical protein
MKGKELCKEMLAKIEKDGTMVKACWYVYL